MDEESLRREITAQVKAEFENQLREMKAQKNLAEEELENAEDSWRVERRRLKSEIDRLEDDLSQAGQPSAAGSAEAQPSFEEKLGQAAAEREAERERLSLELKRTQAALAETIARSGNPARITQAIRDQYELKLAEANRVQLEAEGRFLREKAEWAEDRKGIMGELTLLRRLASSNPSLFNATDRVYEGSESVHQTRIRGLEEQLSDANAAAQRFNEAALKSAQELAAARKEVHRKNGLLSETQRGTDSGGLELLRQEYEAKIQDLTQQRDQLLQDLPDPSRVGAGGSGSGLSAASTDSIDAEVSRVEAAIKAIEKLFDDPDTTASTIARKNAEKAELEAYLQGIRFR